MKQASKTAESTSSLLPLVRSSTRPRAESRFQDLGGQPLDPILQDLCDTGRSGQGVPSLMRNRSCAGPSSRIGTGCPTPMGTVTWGPDAIAGCREKSGTNLTRADPAHGTAVKWRVINPGCSAPSPRGAALPISRNPFSKVEGSSMTLVVKHLSSNNRSSSHIPISSFSFA